MKLDNVFIGFTKDGKERILVKKYDEFTYGCSIPYYKDLKTRKKFSVNEVDENTLKPFSKIIKTKEKASRKKIIKSYELDRSELIDIYKLVYTNIYITRLENERTAYKLIKGNILMRIDDNMILQFKSLDEDKMYAAYRLGLIDEEYCNILSHQPYEDLEQLTEKRELPKKKLLEFDYNRKK